MLKAGDMPEGHPYPRNLPLPSKQQRHDKETRGVFGPIREEHGWAPKYTGPRKEP